jgi:hypothetical protein
MPTYVGAPNTDQIADAIVFYLASLTYSDGSTVYKLAQVEAIKDVTDLVANGGACVEVYANKDKSERRSFGGRIWDTQSWFILSLCSLDTSLLARQIHNVRDALVQPFQAHAQLGNIVSNLFHSQLQDDMQFLRVPRNEVFLRAHLAELITKSEWQVPSPPGVVS